MAGVVQAARRQDLGASPRGHPRPDERVLDGRRRRRRQDTWSGSSAAHARAREPPKSTTSGPRRGDQGPKPERTRAPTKASPRTTRRPLRTRTSSSRREVDLLGLSHGDERNYSTWKILEQKTKLNDQMFLKVSLSIYIGLCKTYFCQCKFHHYYVLSSRKLNW